MSSSINEVRILGRLGQDPETRYTQGGDAVCNLSIATDESYKKDGEKVEQTEWHKVTIFGKGAEIAGEYLKKGHLVSVRGKLRTRKWQDKEGVDRYTTEIVADNYGGLCLLPNGDREERDERPARKSADKKVDKPAPKKQADLGDDDIPF